MIIDSNYEPNDVIIQNPDRPCPEELLKTLGLVQVTYWGFDDKEHQGQMVVAISAMSDVEAFFKQAYDVRFPIERVVPVSAPEYQWDGPKVIADNVSAGFDYRPVQKTDKLSLHSQGLAFDINPRQNPYMRYKNGKRILVAPEDDPTWDPEVPGTLHADHPLVKLMEGFGWEWGGHWTKESGRTDYMHFQKAL